MRLFPQGGHDAAFALQEADYRQFTHPGSEHAVEMVGTPPRWTWPKTVLRISCIRASPPRHSAMRRMKVSASQTPSAKMMVLLSRDFW